MEETPKFNYNKLRGRIVEYCGTIKKFAELIGISEQSVHNRLNNVQFFTQLELYKAISILNIQREEYVDIFFTPLVELNSNKEE